MEEKVIAVVVTYNRQQLLANCINALRSQTKKIDHILVINNGSTDDTEKWLSAQDDLEYFTQKNTGSGGGFNMGIKIAYEKNYDWVWLMDDDGFPKEDALEILLEGTTEKFCLRNCAVINKDDKKSFVWKTGKTATLDEVADPIIQNYAHPFNGTLIHKSIIQKVGFPRKELFIWGDETEYYHRIITKFKIPFYTNAKSIHYHPPCAYSHKKDWDFNSNWKMYYYVRNRFSILQTRYSNKPLIAVFYYVSFLIAFCGLILAFQKTNKFRKLMFVLWPVKDAINKNYQITPSVILKKLSYTGNLSAAGYFSYQIKIMKTVTFRSANPILHKLRRA